MPTRAEKMAAKKIDREIDQIYNANCSNISINMMDIPKIFAEGRKAIAEGRDLKTAIVAFVEQIRVSA